MTSSIIIDSGPRSRVLKGQLKRLAHALHRGVVSRAINLPQESNPNHHHHQGIIKTNDSGTNHIRHTNGQRRDSHGSYHIEAQVSSWQLVLVRLIALRIQSRSLRNIHQQGWHGWETRRRWNKRESRDTLQEHDGLREDTLSRRRRMRRRI